MRYLYLLLFSSLCFAQEGKALRPAPKPECIQVPTTSPPTISCTFREYRFIREASPEISGFRVSRMESGNYIATNMASIFKNPEKSLEKLNALLAKDAQRRQKAGEGCADPQKIFHWDDLALRFEEDRIVFVPMQSSQCPQTVTVSARELDRMLK